MKFILLFLTTFVFVCQAFTQNRGVIHYTSSTDWVKMQTNYKYISDADKERTNYVYGNAKWKEWTSKATLKFSENATLWEIIPDEEDEREWSSRKKEYYKYRDLEANLMLNIENVLGKDYAIEDSISCINWKIRNDLKEIAGHICMNAYYYDTLREKEIVAWFALDMPLSIGPVDYCGLPGVILEVNENNGSIIYTATLIVAAEEDLKITKPTYNPKKRKVITLSEKFDMESKEILNAKKMKRPYWWNVNY